MPAMEIARLDLGGRQTRIVLGDTELLNDHIPDLVACDAAVADSPLLDTWRDAAKPRVVLPPGEDAKQWTVLHALLRSCADRDLARGDRIAAVGGGAICDVGAFAAATYMRGVSLTLVPTTLLAVVDAAVGGKTGIDFLGYKNLVGAFYPADSVLIVPSFLGTLSEREYRSGLAEVIKAAMLADAALFELLEREREAVLRREPAMLREMISRAVAVKADIVNRDFTERGERGFLNLGHTFGHALEAVLGLGTLTHGEAVVWGIGRALDLGGRIGITDPAWTNRVRRVLDDYGYLLRRPAGSTVEIIAAMQKDKKRRRDGLQFVLQRGPQKTELREVPIDEVTAVLDSPA